MDNALGSLSPESLQSLEKLSPREKQELGQMAMQEGVSFISIHIYCPASH